MNSKIKLKSLSFLIWLIINFQANFVNSENQADSDVYVVEHSIDSNDFKDIATINLRTIRQNQNAAQFQSINSAGEQTEQPKSTSNQFIFSIPIQSNKLDEWIKKEMKNSLPNSKNVLYRVRLCKKVPVLTCYVSSFTYLKNLIDSNFQLNLTLNTGINNKLNSISLKTHPSNEQIKSSKETIDALNNFIEYIDYITIHVSIQNIKQGQSPDAETYLEKIRKELEQKEKGAQAGNESFLSKYWVYIVPVMIVMFIMQLVNPEAAAAGGGGGSR